MKTISELIAACSALAESFSDHVEWMPPDDLVGTSIVPAWVHPPMPAMRKTLFFPKVSVVLRDRWLPPLPPDVRTIVRYAIPTNNSVDLLRAAGCLAPGSVLHFVGDLDPLDLTIFLALKHLAAEVHVVLCGVNDTWTKQCVAVRRGAHDLPTIAMTAFERAHLDLLEQWTSVEALVGPVAWQMLKSGYKLELEGAVNPAFYEPEHRAWLIEMLYGGRSNWPRDSFREFAAVLGVFVFEGLQTLLGDHHFDLAGGLYLDLATEARRGSNVEGLVEDIVLVVRGFAQKLRTLGHVDMTG
jgi:hypothetical protein